MLLVNELFFTHYSDPNANHRQNISWLSVRILINPQSNLCLFVCLFVCVCVCVCVYAHRI